MQSAWSTHKQAHKPGPHTWAFVTQKGRGRQFSLPSFDWTGPLRPMMVSPYREVGRPSNNSLHAGDLLYSGIPGVYS